MRESTYRKLSHFMLSRPLLAKFWEILGKSITVSVYILYPILLAVLFFTNKSATLRIFLVTAISFIVLSVIRKIINAPRPYEKFDIKSTYPKKTKGNSFPSRHTFSVFIIALSVLWVNTVFGVVLLCLGVLLSISRVLCGIHFIKDVIAGIAFALLSALIGYIIL